MSAKLALSLLPPQGHQGSHAREAPHSLRSGVGHPQGACHAPAQPLRGEPGHSPWGHGGLSRFPWSHAVCKAGQESALPAQLPCGAAGWPRGPRCTTARCVQPCSVWGLRHCDSGRGVHGAQRSAGTCPSTPDACFDRWPGLGSTPMQILCTGPLIFTYAPPSATD